MFAVSYPEWATTAQRPRSVPPSWMCSSSIQLIKHHCVLIGLCGSVGTGCHRLSGCSFVFALRHIRTAIFARSPRDPAAARRVRGAQLFPPYPGTRANSRGPVGIYDSTHSLRAVHPVLLCDTCHSRYHSASSRAVLMCCCVARAAEWQPCTKRFWIALPVW